jgi:hypothetical protein
MPWKRLDIGPRRLRVVERGRDQIVEVDGLDVEGLRMWAQPSRNICTTSSWSLPDRNASFTACGWVVTWLSASAVAKILTRILSMVDGGTAGFEGRNLYGQRRL